MKSPTDDADANLATATLSDSGLGRGMFQTHMLFNSFSSDIDQSGEHTLAVGQPVFAPPVGKRYAVQVLLNSLPLLLHDILVITAVIGICRVVFYNLGITVGIDVSAALAPIATGFVLLSFEFGLYPGIKLSPVEELRRLIVSVTCIFIVWAIGVAVLHQSLGMQRFFLIVVYLGCVITLPITRSSLRHFLGKRTKWGIPTLVCGDDAAAVSVYQWLENNRQLGLRPLGVVGDPNSLDIGSDDKWYLGTWSEAYKLSQNRGVYWAIVAPSEEGLTTVSSLITNHLYMFPCVHVLTEITGLPNHWNSHQLDGLTGIHLQQNLMLPLPRLGKRLMDIVLTLIGGILLLPLLCYIALAVKLSSRGPVLYGNERIGRNGRHFKMWKFRSMFTNSDAVLEAHFAANPELREELESTHKLKRDPRVTRIGRFIRKTSLDELPQLWNVLTGEMSLVGPRPMLVEEKAKYGECFALYATVAPGITGLWQVSGRSQTAYSDRLRLVAYYVHNWSPWLDVYLLLKTIRIVLFGKGAY